MKRPNLTPGPWHYTKGVSPSVNSQIERTPVNIARTIYGSHDEALANARAIASVPALLETLELAEATIQRLAPNGSRATQGTRDVIAAALRLAGYTF